MTVTLMLMIVTMTHTLCVCDINRTDQEFADLQEQYNNILEKFVDLEQQLAQNLSAGCKLREEREKLHKHEDQLTEIVSFQSKMLQDLLKENQVLRRELLELYQKKAFKSNPTNNTNSEASSELHRSWFPTGAVIDGSWMLATAVANITQYTITPVGRNYQTKQARTKLIQDLNNTRDFLCNESPEVPRILRQNHRSMSSTIWLQHPALLVESVKSDAEFVTRLMLLLGANPMIRPPKAPLLNPTALHWSAVRGKANLTVALIHAGAVVDARDEHNQTALHWAAGNGQLEVTKVLLDNGASTNAVTDSNWTPLHYAALRGHKEEAMLLLNGATDVDALLAIRNDQGKTAREVALSFGWEELADWLFIQEHLQGIPTTTTTASGCSPEGGQFIPREAPYM